MTAEPPVSGAGKAAAQQARIEREAEALRENLRRRKEQVRARRVTEPMPVPGEAE